MMAPVIVWFRRDLRVRDHAALTAAAEGGRSIIPVYVSDTLDAGGASRWWLHYSLARLGESLSPFGAELLIAQGDPATVLSDMAAATGAEGVYCHARGEPSARRHVEALREHCPVHEFHGSTLLQPGAVMTLSGKPFKVFTPFWRAATALGEPPVPTQIPPGLHTTHAGLQSIALDDLDLLPRSPDWAEGLRNVWTPGEAGALDRLEQAVETAARYSDERDRPDLDSTSRLSPHLHFGEISPRQVWHDLVSGNPGNESTGSLLRQLYWRDFSAYLLHHFPSLATEPLRPEFRQFPWIADGNAVESWQTGRTGYPIVDAGMRQLWSTGWMHNRVRMIAASFLVKDLLVHWKTGADWFMDTLVDADLANNSASWQWVAGSGTDAAPYFRIFNPVLQGKKFDPLGDYVRRWVPELGRLPARFIHEPWKAPLDEQKRANVLIGMDYPQPILDHREARETALATYNAARKQDTLGITST